MSQSLLNPIRGRGLAPRPAWCILLVPLYEMNNCCAYRLIDAKCAYLRWYHFDPRSRGYRSVGFIILLMRCVSLRQCCALGSLHFFRRRSLHHENTKNSPCRSSRPLRSDCYYALSDSIKRFFHLTVQSYVLVVLVETCTDTR